MPFAGQTRISRAYFRRSSRIVQGARSGAKLPASTRVVTTRDIEVIRALADKWGASRAGIRHRRQRLSEIIER